MKALIFDVDGTLLDSYPSICDRFLRCCRHFGLKYEYEYVRNGMLRSSMAEFLEYTCQKEHINKIDFFTHHNSIESDLDLIEPYEGVIETLKELKQRGYKLFIYTHRGVTLDKLLRKFDMKGYFVEIIDSTFKFERKPSPQAVNYLIDKYHLELGSTYYVGDRGLDIDCAVNAKIKSIYFDSAKLNFKLPYTYKIDNFKEILDLKL